MTSGFTVACQGVVTARDPPKPVNRETRLIMARPARMNDRLVDTITAAGQSIPDRRTVCEIINGLD